MTDWPGTKDQRELRRAQLIGKYFLTSHHDTTTDTGWSNFVKEKTRLRDRWIWSEKHKTDRTESLQAFRAQVAGILIRENFAAGIDGSASQLWFTNAAKQDDWAEAWFFDAECLKADGWLTKQVPSTTDNAGKKTPAYTAWSRP